MKLKHRLSNYGYIFLILAILVVVGGIATYTSPTPNPGHGGDAILIRINQIGEEKPLQQAIDEGNFVTSFENLVVLGAGIAHMTGEGHVICKQISFHPWSSGEVIPIGVLYYPPNIGYDWGHWNVYFKEVNKHVGTAIVCIDSGGDWSGTVGAEHVAYVIYGKT